MATLRSVIAADVESVFLDTDEFAESVTYTPAAGGGARTITVVIEEVGTFRTDDNMVSTMDEIIVVAQRDPSATMGGIDRPRLGDTILRSATEDPEQRPYAFSGEIEDSEPDTWSLKYIRHRIVQVGVEQRLS